MKEKLKTIDAETLMHTPMPPLKFIVDGLLSSGLHILAGSPKIGKSWLALWLALQVSKGEKLWEFTTTKSDVLYLCLEDSFARIQDRLFKITDDAPPTLQFAIMSGRIGDGLEKQVEDYIAEHQNTGLIIIDTLQKVRDKSNPNANVYERDYDDIDVLKNIADKHKIAILLIHHLRKTHDNDPVNMISGSSGISGSADTNFILQKEKRTNNAAKLICVGRDIEQREIYLEWSKETFLWETISAIEVEKITTPNEISILCDFIKSETSFTGTATELIEKLNGDYSPSTLKKKIIKHISELSKNGISYIDKRTYERREFTLTYDMMTDMTLETDVGGGDNLPSEVSAVSGNV
ncbi:AAA family ATPase [Chakrabartyella piscis]|uniref:AAA family ATPase n=1 Tax=Chakrabartyella piscis TaxID=2918914 RepID=UPI002958CCF8|nr:AAA family ATPase [Chakrabartyella piscis]